MVAAPTRDTVHARYADATTDARMAAPHADGGAGGARLLPALADDAARGPGRRVALDAATLGSTAVRARADRQLLLLRVGRFHRRDSLLGSAAAAAGVLPRSAAHGGGLAYPPGGRLAFA